jgi:predicted Ser/Thr protein kinase
MDKPPDDLTGRVLGDFRILRCLGHGGMGRVYLAEQLSLRRKVALKFLRPDLAANPSSLERFKNEALAAARITHANIVQVYAIGETDGLNFIALEYVEGRNLGEYLEKKGPPQVLLALSIMRQVAAALQRAAEAGIVHRDIKPENILLTRKGEVKVTDFGLSRCLEDDRQQRLTQSGVTMGTPLYMSPEQVQGGQPVDARTDIYSFGVTCYHMLAGRPPFRGDNPFEVALQHVNKDPEPLHAVRPDLPPELCAVVHRMMARDPAQRYQTGRDLLRDLARLRERLVQAGGPQHTQELSLDSNAAPSNPVVPVATMPAVRTATAGGRWAWMVFALSLVAALAAGAGAGWLWRQHRANAAALTADAETTAPEPFLSLARREQFLKDAVAEYANPRDEAQRRMGIGACLELGLFYLEQHRLDDADRFFADLTGRPREMPLYRFLGQIGHAIVLGLQDRAEESDDLFQKLFFDPRTGQERPMSLLLLKQSTRLRQWVATALDYNRANQTPRHPFPEQLERLRHPPGKNR